MACNEETAHNTSIADTFPVDNLDDTVTPTTGADIGLDEYILVGDDSSTLSHDIGLDDTVLTEDTAYDCRERYPVPPYCNSYDSTAIEWTCYAIDGYYDGMLAVSGDCTSCTDSVDDAWDGSFDSATSCDSPYNAQTWYPAASPISIDGKEIYVFSSIVYLETYYFVDIECYDSTGEVSYTIWAGTKTVGATPEGTFDTDSNGCDSTSTIDIITTSCA